MPTPIAILYLHGLSPPTQVPILNAKVGHALHVAITQHNPDTRLLFESTDFACLLSDRQRRLRQIMRSANGDRDGKGRRGIWRRAAEWVREAVTETLLNQVGV